ncbi:quinolinate phosphoribosyltransferase [Campylobacter fetus]|uniref:quinolinate phosphoribosyltransferase n=1 Tax=Campylobacter fetus TaxID=196 RepID=UPI0003C27E9E|nr:quinolinate phosphoribosyltransferase [Campylobacter fetus]AGZ81215.1 quinolinate phosphoribosyltransferase-like protein [Campylobacter fetus subsp. testudinum 03-427]AJB44970.1 molybdenum ABC transporter [Campylobacter fetus subsp. testudinum]EAI4321615.1 molybdenum ABC transporter [Campylobacter fetus]EAI4391469.1 molybdenum ABC transporter [Campylobacter fetus]EAK0826692.1 molybdenum ABC transporter [Campylobacter fetus]
MIKFSNSELEDLVKSDIPFNDLTTELMETEAKAKLSIISRGEITLSCLDVVSQICKARELEFHSDFKNSMEVKSGTQVLSVIGDFNELHAIYKTIQNLLEYACGIATSANLIVKSVKETNPNCEVLVTRKVFPFAKKLCLKAALEGGAKVHRLGLSDSVLFFENHTNAYINLDEFLSDISKFKKRLCERKIIVEASDLEFAKAALKARSDGVQCDKMSVDEVQRVVEFKNTNFTDAIILAAGGINESNAAQYAKTGINAIVTSAVYKGVANLGAKITLL